VVLGDKARPLFGGLGFTEMAQTLRMAIIDGRRVGEDLRLRMRPQAAG